MRCVAWIFLFPLCIHLMASRSLLISIRFQVGRSFKLDLQSLNAPQRELGCTKSMTPTIGSIADRTRHKVAAAFSRGSGGAVVQS
ncbi:uncharacterized protein F4807DRAFT_160317 [Annulohypoxylon truncatum]|uniref:uncharacterized protein n=1 Tax=Annulohypoxylon truncatum TaxID=327061 RepID=UPI00200868F2|nr:uncharacterized protein F4807DRAFT_160317 [Annulohypoxylon truncatum]KAI1207960.1 hypothetical protein F4807DRAFT_160317 [Annulohypoxylon truncatum]